MTALGIVLVTIGGLTALGLGVLFTAAWLSERHHSGDGLANAAEEAARCTVRACADEAIGTVEGERRCYVHARETMRAIALAEAFVRDEARRAEA